MPGTKNTGLFCAAFRKRKEQKLRYFCNIMSGEIINKVAESGLVTIDLEKYLPQKGSIGVFDLKEFLFMGMILKEKDFREALKNHDWEQFSNKCVAVFCSADDKTSSGDAEAVVGSFGEVLISSNCFLQLPKIAARKTTAINFLYMSFIIISLYFKIKISRSG